MVETWFAIFWAMVTAYVILDGRNLGAATLRLIVASNAAERRQVLDAIGPLWTWHEVWLVAAGGVLLLAFPALLATAFAGYYLALFLVLWLLILRGVSLESARTLRIPSGNRSGTSCSRDRAPCWRCLLGLALGNLLRGVPLGASGAFHMALFTDFGVRGHVGLIDWYTLSVAALFAGGVRRARSDVSHAQDRRTGPRAEQSGGEQTVDRRHCSRPCRGGRNKDRAPRPRVRLRLAPSRAAVRCGGNRRRRRDRERTPGTTRPARLRRFLHAHPRRACGASRGELSGHAWFNARSGVLTHGVPGSGPAGEPSYRTRVVDGRGAFDRVVGASWSAALFAARVASDAASSESVSESHLSQDRPPFLSRERSARRFHARRLNLHEGPRAFGLRDPGRCRWRSPSDSFSAASRCAVSAWASRVCSFHRWLWHRRACPSSPRRCPSSVTSRWVLFVYAIGLQVGPGFVASLRAEGLRLNLLAAAVLVLGALSAACVARIVAIPQDAAAGVYAGSFTTATPALAGGQVVIRQVLASQPDHESAALASTSLAYAVTYPLGVVGPMLLLVMLRRIFRVRMEDERSALAAQERSRHQASITTDFEIAETVSCGSACPGTAASAPQGRGSLPALPWRRSLRAAREHRASAWRRSPCSRRAGRCPPHRQRAGPTEHPRPLAGHGRVPPCRSGGHQAGSAAPPPLRDLALRGRTGVTIGHVIRAGVELVPTGNLSLKFGDHVTVVGPESGIRLAAEELGNEPEALNRPYLFPVFVGIALGVLVGAIPFTVPGLPVPLQIGLAGGPFLVAIALSQLGSVGSIIWYMPVAANQMVRDIGLCIFLACVASSRRRPARARSSRRPPGSSSQEPPSRSFRRSSSRALLDGYSA